MDLLLAGKRAIVTGSSSGIGEATAKTLAYEGAAVVVHGRNKGEADRVAQEIEAAGGKAVVVLGDLSTDTAANQVADEAVSALGGIDILVNNVSSYDQASWMEAKPEAWADLFNQGVLSSVRLIQRLAPAMKERGWGRFIQIASAVAMQPSASGPNHSATKAAVVNLSVSLSKDLADTGITANTISPGGIATASLQKFMRGMAEEQGWGDDWAEIERHIVKEMVPNPSGRLGRVEDIAHAVAFVASPLSGYINGANLRVDGGLVVGIN